MTIILIQLTLSAQSIPTQLASPSRWTTLAIPSPDKKIRYSGRLNPSKLNRRILRIFSDQSIDPYVP